MDATTTTTPTHGLLPSRRHGQRQRAGAAAAAAEGGGGAVRNLAYSFLDPLLCELRLLLAPRPLYGPVKATMLADGHAVAAGLVVAAVLGNHVRRVLAPWLGQFLWWHPVQAMRLARGTPHFFIEQQVLAATDAATLGFWALQTIALAATKALLRHRLLADATTTTTTTTITASATGLTKPKSQRGKGFAGGGGGGGGRSSSSSSSSSSSAGPRAAAMRDTTSSMACLTDCYRIIYLTLCIMHVEYAYAEACWAASWIHAATHVALRGTTAEQLFTYRLLTGHHHHHHHHDQQLARTESDQGGMAHWRGVSLIAGLLVWWLWRHLVRPLRRHGVVAWAFSGLPVLGGLIGAATAHIIKYSNKYFIWLEMSEMLLTWAWLLLGLALVAVWRLCDGQDAE
ncbi:hypothetical protein ARSEF1564_000042 [Beauveria bassiana]